MARRFLNGDLTTGATYSYTAAGEAIDGESESDDYGLWDVFASYEAMDNLFVSAKVANLTDEEYVPWASSGKGPGRTYYVGLELTF